MNKNNQFTIEKAFAAEGVGLHTGCSSSVKITPGLPGEGIRFFRTGIMNFPCLKAAASNVINTMRCTVLGNKYFSISTVEHFLAASYAMGIHNLRAQKDCKPPIYLCNVKRKQRHKEVWVSGRYQHTANVPSPWAPTVRILLLPL